METLEKQMYLMPKLVTAVREADWKTVSAIIVLNPEMMDLGLGYAYSDLPDEYRFSIPTDCYIHIGDHIPLVRKYVRQARKYAPIEKRIPDWMRAMPEITVYRAGQEPLDRAKYRISWTDKPEIARWFYERALYRGAPECHLYRGVIRPEKIIRYTDERNESEVMQYNSVRDTHEWQA